MKPKTKALTLALCAVLLVATTVFATMAYLTAKDTVVNTFTVGDVQITLDETDVDVMGKKDGETRVKKNAYHLLPGHTYIKDPTVTVLKDSEDAYVRMIVTVNDISKLEAAFPQAEHPEYYGTNGVFLLQMLVDRNTNWECVDVDGGTYEFRYFEKVAKNTDNNTVLPALFTEITIPGEIDNDHIEHLKGVEITVTAHAIQADGFDDAAAAWAKWTVNNPDA